MEVPKVSIIIPVYNLEDYIERCLDSVISQSLQDIEVICIDDASKDNSLEILDNYKAKDSRIKIFSVEKSGQGINRNLGINKASGEYIGFVDGDDCIQPTMFEELYKAAVENESEIAFCHAACYNDAGRRIKYPYYDNERKRFRSKNEVTTFSNRDIVGHLPNITAVCWNKIYKRTFLTDFGYSFGTGVIHEDLPFFFQTMLNANKITLVRKPLYNYSAFRTGSTTQAVMSMSTRIVESFRTTQKKIEIKLQEPAVAEKFFEYKIAQLLSFLSYAFNRHELSRLTKLRFFCVVKSEFDIIQKEHLKSLSKYDYFHFWSVKKKYVKLFRTRSLAEAIAFHTQDLNRFKQFIQLVSQIPKNLVIGYYKKLV